MFIVEHKYISPSIYIKWEMPDRLNDWMDDTNHSTLYCTHCYWQQQHRPSGTAALCTHTHKSYNVHFLLGLYKADVRIGAGSSKLLCNQ